MIIMTITEVRPATDVPFFEQYMLNRPRRTVSDIFRAMRPRVIMYEARYSPDVLTRISILRFRDQATYDEFMAYPNIQAREQNMVKHNLDHSISGTTGLKEMDKAEFDLYCEEITNQAWPASQFVIHITDNIGADRPLKKAAKPVNDRLDYDRWFLEL